MADFSFGFFLNGLVGQSILKIQIKCINFFSHFFIQTLKISIVCDEKKNSHSMWKSKNQKKKLLPKSLSMRFNYCEMNLFLLLFLMSPKSNNKKIRNETNVLRVCYINELWMKLHIIGGKKKSVDMKLAMPSMTNRTVQMRERSRWIIVIKKNLSIIY